MEKTRHFFIPHLAESFNDFIKRKHSGYNSKKRPKDAIKNHAEIVLKNIDPIKRPIKIEWTPVLTKPKNHSKKKRGYDVLNYVHQYKYTEDQLQKLKKIVNDGNKYVVRHELNSPVFIPNQKQNGIILSITELTEDEINYYEKNKIEKFEAIKDQLISDDEIDLLLAKNHFGVE